MFLGVLHDPVVRSYSLIFQLVGVLHKPHDADVLHHSVVGAEWFYFVETCVLGVKCVHFGKIHLLKFQE